MVEQTTDELLLLPLSFLILMIHSISPNILHYFTEDQTRNLT